MTAIDLIAAALPPATPPEEPQPGVCCVTGAETSTIAREHGIKCSFTNLDLLRAPGSDRVGLAAWRALNYAPARQSSWWCDGVEFRQIKRAEVRRLVLDGTPAGRHWCGYATTSYKKHGALRCPVSGGRSQVWLFEMLPVDCSDRGEVMRTWERLRAAQDAGISRPLIETLEISPAYMAKVGIKAWLDFERWARPRRLSPLYQFLAYLLPSKEELKPQASTGEPKHAGDNFV